MAQFRTETDQSNLYGTRAKSVAAKVVLRGRVVTMDAALSVIDDGVVCIDGKLLAHVGAAGAGVPSEFTGSPIIDTAGTIYPGLIELHNHPAYNAIPLWEVPTRFPNRGVWTKNDNYRRRVKLPATLLAQNALSDYAMAVVRFVECRAILGGVTTTQGITLEFMNPDTRTQYVGLVRNVEAPDDPTWPTAQDYIPDFKSHDDANTRYGPLVGNMTKPYILHLCEGTDAPTRALFDYFRKPNGTWLIGKNLVCIHATALEAPEYDQLRAASGIVWSPLSNMLLYGETAKVELAAAAGVPISIGSDWAPSGTKNLLGELKIAKLVSANKGGLFSDTDLVRMVTTIPAKAIGWDPYLGSVERDKQADLFVIEGVSGDPYAKLIAASEADLVAVLIEGRPRVGRATVLDPRTSDVELIRVGGQDLVFDTIETATHPLATMNLTKAISTLTFGLEHLPELASSFTTHHALTADMPDKVFLHLDMDEEFATDLRMGLMAIGPGDVDRMQLEPLTAVDDRNYVGRLKANPNLPAWLKNQL